MDFIWNTQHPFSLCIQPLFDFRKAPLNDKCGYFASLFAFWLLEEHKPEPPCSSFPSHQSSPPSLFLRGFLFHHFSTLCPHGCSVLLRTLPPFCVNMTLLPGRFYFSLPPLFNIFLKDFIYWTEITSRQRGRQSEREKQAPH